MKLLEHEGKQLLKEVGIPIPTSSVVTSANSLNAPIVLKSQVLTGGRAKAGGIMIAKSDNDIQPAIDTLLSLSIKGLLPKVILAEEMISIKRELYVSILIDRATGGIKILANKNGGVEVEDTEDFKSWNISYSNIEADVIGQELADYFELSDQTFSIQDLIENLHRCFIHNDATLIEINPLILTTKGTLVAGDCKVVLDDAAAFRHQWSFEDMPVEANFVTIDPSGNVATIANGAGLAMATVDAAFDAGLQPANFLDIGGGANTETLLKAFNKIVEYDHLQAIIINIFAGITRADEVARAIVAAKKQIVSLPPLFIRLAGTNYESAVKILEDEDISIMPNLESCLSAAKKVTHG